MKHNSTDCIIVAAGKGKRLAMAFPKAFVKLAGKPLFIHSLLQFAGHKAISRIIVVVPAAMIQKARRIAADLHLNKEIKFVAGGEHRWQSVKNGVGASKAGWVLIHDSARPFVTRKVIDAVLAAAGKYDAVIAATPEHDTVRRFSGDRALGTIDRNELIRVQTPQLFLRNKLLDAFEHAASLASPPTDEAMLMERAGVAVGVAPGDPLNFKITTKEDLRLAEAFCRQRNKKARPNFS
jgi:2-C-methyl-D-erythritol 4-phosphate cytidylyltransferase